MAEKLGESWREEERRLHRAESMSDAALENLYDPVIVTDAAGSVVFWNRAAAGLFGPLTQAEGRPIAAAILDARIAEAVERAIHQEHVSAAEGEAGFVSITSGETQRTYRLRATPMRDNTGLIGAVAVLEDITHLRELDRLKTEFIGVASHELRTPVTSLLLSVELMQQEAVGALNKSQKEIVAAQREDLERLERMMRDLLELTRLESGVTPPRFELIDPATIISSSADAVRPQAEEKGVELNIESSENLPGFRADAAQIGRVLINLLNNAIRHTPAGGRVTLSAQVSADSGKLLFKVCDTGAGIPEAYKDRIFERFVQVPGATGGGSGLGLSIARNIVKAHQGEISVESSPGEGSMFIVTLPLGVERSAAGSPAG
jgi:NtrC-family two-component system sensor histidine kinase KinB